MVVAVVVDLAGVGGARRVEVVRVGHVEIGHHLLQFALGGSTR